MKGCPKFGVHYRFPLLDDLFIIRFTYKKDENALKNGVQSDVKIIHRDSNTQVLHYDSNEGKLKIKFSFLKEQFDEEILKVIEVHKIEAEINELDIQFGDPEAENYYPKEIKKRIDDLKKKQRIIKSYYSVNGADYGFEDFNSFQSSLIYEAGLYEPHKYYLTFLPLLNYAFDIKQEYLRKIQKQLNLSNDELEDLLIRANVKREEFSLKTDNIGEYLKRLEIECLDSLQFNTPDYTGGKTFDNALYQLMSRYQVDLFMSLFEKEPILDDTIGEENLSIKRLFDNKNNAVILNPIMDEGEVVLPDNLTYFVKDFVNNGIMRALNTIGEIYRSVHYVPAVRTKMDRFFRIGNGESYLQEVLYTLHQTNLTATGKLFIDNYLQKFGIADSIELTLAEDSSGTKIFLLKDGKKQELADVGYGVAQVLPIILKIGSLISQS